MSLDDEDFGMLNGHLSSIAASLIQIAETLNLIAPDLSGGVLAVKVVDE